MSYINNIHAIDMAQSGQNKKQWVGAAIGAASSLLGGLFSRNSQAKLQRESDERQQAYYEKNYAQQRKDALEDYAQQRKDYVDDLSKQYSRQVESLQNAGMNPVLAYGDMNAAQPLGGEVRASQGSTSVGSAAPYVDLLGNTSAFAKLGAEIDNLKANTNKTEAETNKVQTEQEFIKSQKDELLPKQVQQCDAMIEQIKADKDLKDEQKTEITQKIENLKSEQKLIDFNLEKNREFKPEELKALKANIAQFLSNANANNAAAYLSNVTASLKEMGLGVGGNMIESIAALLVGNKDGKLFDALKSGVGNILGNISNALSDIYTYIADKDQFNENKNNRKWNRDAPKNAESAKQGMRDTLKKWKLYMVGKEAFNAKLRRATPYAKGQFYSQYEAVCRAKGYEPVRKEQFFVNPHGYTQRIMEKPIAKKRDH